MYVITLFHFWMDDNKVSYPLFVNLYEIMQHFRKPYYLFFVMSSLYFIVRTDNNHFLLLRTRYLRNHMLYLCFYFSIFPCFLYIYIFLNICIWKNKLLNLNLFGLLSFFIVIWTRRKTLPSSDLLACRVIYKWFITKFKGWEWFSVSILRLGRLIFTSLFGFSSCMLQHWLHQFSANFLLIFYYCKWGNLLI